jgi:hypothetical protein
MTDLIPLLLLVAALVSGALVADNRMYGGLDDD